MIQQFTIRLAIVNDAKEILEIWHEGTAISIGIKPVLQNKGFLKYFEDVIKNQTEVFRVWVATTEAGQIIGWQSLLPCRNNPILRGLMAESSTYIRRKPGVPRLGEHMLNYAIRQAVNSPLQYIIGFVGTSNRAALRMVHALGFVRIGILPISRKVPATTEAYIYAFVVPPS